MKFRTSFVTNSSSSSFIIAGVKTDSSGFDYDKAYDLNIDFTNTDDEMVIGHSIARMYESYGIKEISLDGLDEKVKQAKENVAKFGLNPDDVKIYFGVEYS